MLCFFFFFFFYVYAPNEGTDAERVAIFDQIKETLRQCDQEGCMVLAPLFSGFLLLIAPLKNLTLPAVSHLPDANMKNGIKVVVIKRSTLYRFLPLSMK